MTDGYEDSEETLSIHIWHLIHSWDRILVKIIKIISPFTAGMFSDFKAVSEKHGKT